MQLMGRSGSLRGNAVEHVLGFLAVAGCFLFWVTYLVVLRAVAHAKRPDAAGRKASALAQLGNERLAARPAKTVA